MGTVRDASLATVILRHVDSQRRSLGNDASVHPRKSRAPARAEWLGLSRRRQRDAINASPVGDDLIGYCRGVGIDGAPNQCRPVGPAKGGARVTRGQYRRTPGRHCGTPNQCRPVGPAEGRSRHPWPISAHPGTTLRHTRVTNVPVTAATRPLRIVIDNAPPG